MSDRQDMIPRIVVRDADDADLILMALRLYMMTRMNELLKEARKPKADQFKLSLIQRNETDNITSLMSAIVDNLTAVENKGE